MSYARDVMGAAVGVALLITMSQAHAVATFNATDRSVEASDGTNSNSQISVVTLGTFIASEDSPTTADISASQDTTTAPLSISGTGSANHLASGPSDPGFAESFFQADFSLAEAHNYTLGGNLHTSIEFGPASARFDLVGSGGTNIVFVTPAVSGESNAPISGSGMLMAGSYTLTVQAIAGDINNNDDALSTSDFNFTLTLAEKGNGIPEPTTASIWLTLLAGIGGARRLHRRRAA